MAEHYSRARDIGQEMRNDHAILRREFVPDERYWLEQPTGKWKPIGAIVANLIINSGNIVARDPGLLPGISQSFEHKCWGDAQ
jgi:hypothetical protein